MVSSPVKTVTHPKPLWPGVHQKAMDHMIDALAYAASMEVNEEVSNMLTNTPSTKVMQLWGTYYDAEQLLEKLPEAKTREMIMAIGMHACANDAVRAAVALAGYPMDKDAALKRREELTARFFRTVNP